MVYHEYILKKLRMCYGHDEDDISHDEWFNKMSKNRVFDEVLAWERLIRRGNQIRCYVKDVYGVELGDTD